MGSGALELRAGLREDGPGLGSNPGSPPSFRRDPGRSAPRSQFPPVENVGRSIVRPHSAAPRKRPRRWW